jgi:hypothetical protein
MTGRARRRGARLRVLGLAVALVACQREGADAGSQESAVVEVRAAVTIAPVVDDHPWVIALLTALSLERPAGVEARLEGRTEAGGRRIAEPVLVAERREALAAALAAYEDEHPRPPELRPVWERITTTLAGDQPTDVWQLYFIQIGPEHGADAGSFELDGGARARLVPHPLGSVVELELSADQRERFAKLSRAEVGHRVAIVIDDEAVSVPVVREPITGGRVQIWPGAGEDPEAASQALLDRLRGG